VGEKLAPALCLLIAALGLRCSGSSCDTDSPCPDHQVCVSGKCEDTAKLEAPCDAGCPDGQSCHRGQDFPSGACTLDCGSGVSCPTLSTCTALATGSVCLEQCETDSDCPQGFVCAALASGKLCVAPEVARSAQTACTGSPRLVGGGTIGPASPPGGCQRNIEPSALPAGQVQHLGTHAVGEQLSFPVPPGQASVSVVEQAVQAIDSVTFQGFVIDNSAVPLVMLFPDGGVLYDDRLPFPSDPTSALLLFGGDTPQVGTLTFPNTTPSLALASAGVPAGDWSVVVSDYAYECLLTPDCTGGSDGGLYDLTVLTRPGVPASGALDVAIYLVTESNLTSAAAVGDSSFQRVVRTLASTYAAAGICLGTVTVYDVPGWAKTKYASGIDIDQTGPCADLPQLFTLAQPGNTLNFFFVDALTSNSQPAGSIVVGVDGTIPGPSTIGGTVASAAAVTMADLKAGAIACGPTVSPNLCGADEVAMISAHEGAHFLGLFHTTESAGVDFDPLADTAACMCSQCVSATRAKLCADAPLSADGGADCAQANVACGGGHNLMFWQLSDVSTGALSPEQAAVMRSNPLVH
jgi:hypothetical protein